MRSNILDNNDNKYWIWISRIKNISNVQIHYLIKLYNGPKNLWNAKDEELKKLKGINNNIIKEIINPIYKKDLNKYITYMYTMGISIITMDSKYYPIKLKRLYDYPIVLYAKGDISILNDNSIAITGSTMPSKYGIEMAKRYSYMLAKNDITIISGLSYGIDTYVHIGTLNAKGKTIAVVASGLNYMYPKENQKLYDRIVLNGGVVISEYIVGTKPQKLLFPARNRIISGLSDGLLVIEAKEKCGAQIVVDYALEQGKNVFALPGNITSSNSIGTNKLIQQGAKLVLNIEDILEEYVFNY